MTCNLYSSSFVFIQLNLFFADDSKSRRRQRRFFPPEILQLSSLSSSNSNNNSNDDKTTSDNSSVVTAPRCSATTNTEQLPNTATTTIIANSPLTSRSSSKRNDLSYHMENARKGVLNVTNSDLNRKKYSKASNKTDSDLENGKLTRKTYNLVNHISSAKTSRRIDEITALTHETLTRVDNLVNKRDKCAANDIAASTTTTTQLPSILKRKQEETSMVPPPVVSTASVPSGPVSILKRKVSTDETTASSSSYSTPVTFSPSVVEPATTNRKQGILKKRRSLDESQVLRHRSCSPDVANKIDSRSILKNRRSSLEDIVRIQSPDTTIQGTLFFLFSISQH